MRAHERADGGGDELCGTTETHFAGRVPLREAVIAPELLNSQLGCEPRDPVARRGRDTDALPAAGWIASHPERFTCATSDIVPPWARPRN
jgi:hypothetical protein